MRAVITPEGVLAIEENLTVLFDGQVLSEDLKRSISGRYSPAEKKGERTGFVLLDSTLDEQPARFPIRRSADRLELVFAPKGKQLSMGRHQFKLRYELLNVITSDPEGDSLSWLLVRESSAVIRKIDVSVTLPGGKRNFRHAEARMGEFLEGAAFPEPGRAVTTRPLQPGESFQLILTWEHGLLPNLDGGRTLLRIGDTLMFGFLLLYSLFIAWRWGRSPQVPPAPPGLIPPEGLSPALLRHLRGTPCDSRGLTAEIFSLAVKGFVQVDGFTFMETPTQGTTKESGRVFSPLDRMMRRRYRLRLTGDPQAEDLTSTERILLHNLFPSSDTHEAELVLDASATSRVKTAFRALSRHLKELAAPFAFRHESRWSLGLLLFQIYTAFVMFRELSRGIGGVEPNASHAIAFIAPLFLLAPFLGGEKIWKNSTPWFILRTIIPLLFCSCALVVLKEQGIDTLSLLALAGSVLVLGLSWKTMPTYSEEGFHLQEQIRGFELGLSSRAQLKEEDTIERFEGLLPYAYALDQEQSLIARYDPLIATIRHHARWYTTDTPGFTGGAEYFSLTYELGESLKNILGEKS